MFVSAQRLKDASIHFLMEFMLIALFGAHAFTLHSRCSARFLTPDRGHWITGEPYLVIIGNNDEANKLIISADVKILSV